MEVDSYEINSETCAILNFNNEVTKIIENNQEYLIPKKTFEVMDDSCAYYGSSYDGRIKGTKMILGSNYKLPIIVEESNDLIFFPTNGTSSEKCSWISLKQILKYEPYKGYTKVTFLEGRTVVVKMSYNSFDMQVLRATRLSNLIKNRTNK